MINLLCSPVIVINLTTYPWNSTDEKHLEVAKVRCKKIFHNEAPCLKKFIKKEPLVYRAICGDYNE